MPSTVSPKTAYEDLKSGDAVLIDVREADEFKSEHIAYALSMPLSTLDANVDKLFVPQGRKIYVQCHKGARGEMACRQLLDMKHHDNEILNVEGGIEGWKSAGLPVTASKATKLSIFRQVQIIVGFLIALCVAMGFAGMNNAFIVAGVFGGALCFAGLTGFCGLAVMLAKMPWNRVTA